MPLVTESLDELKEKLAPELRVLVIVISNAWGGLEQTAFADARLLQDAGFNVTLLIRKDSPIDEAACTSVTSMDREYFHSSLPKRWDISLMRTIRDTVKKRRINLVHCHQGSLISSIVPSLLGIPGTALVLSRHILNNHNKKNLYHALLYRRVDYILVLSNTMKHNMLATFPIPEKKLRIVNLGLDLESFNPARADHKRMRSNWNIPEDRFLIGVVGRLDPMKRQDLLIKSLAGIREFIPKIHGVIVGAESPGLNGSYMDSLRKTVSDLRMEEYISIVGPHAQIPEVMAALDLFVMPSQEEAFGLVALEAMAMGVPSLLSRAGSAEELAWNGRSELFRPGDAFDLSRKIKNLYSNEAHRKAMAEKAQAYVLEKFSVEQRLHRTLEIYMRCSRRRRLER